MLMRPLIRASVEQLIADAQSACTASDRASAQIILDELQHRTARKAETLRAFLLGYLTAPAPLALPSTDRAAPIPSPRKRMQLAGPPAPAWWFRGCGKAGKAGEANPARVRARTAEWNAASPAFRAHVETGAGWWAVPLASWPECPERERIAARREEVAARDWMGPTLEWPSVDEWQLAANRAPAIRTMGDGRPNPEDSLAWAAFMRKARERAWARTKGVAA